MAGSQASPVLAEHQSHLFICGVPSLNKRLATDKTRITECGDRSPVAGRQAKRLPYVHLSFLLRAWTVLPPNQHGANDLVSLRCGASTAGLQAKAAMSEVRHMPMLVPPATWRTPWNGGHVLTHACIMRGWDSRAVPSEDVLPVHQATYQQMPKVRISSGHQLD